jgi:hypothetical protein
VPVVQRNLIAHDRKAGRRNLLADVAVAWRVFVEFDRNDRTVLTLKRVLDPSQRPECDQTQCSRRKSQLILATRGNVGGR